MPTKTIKGPIAFTHSHSHVLHLLTNLLKLTHELSIMKLRSHMEGVRAMASLVKKRIMVWKRYVKIRVSIEMQKLDESRLEMQRMSERIRLLRAQKRK